MIEGERRPMTEQEKLLMRSSRVTSQQLAAWGVPWPPPRGWTKFLSTKGVLVTPPAAPTGAPQNMMVGRVGEPLEAPTTRGPDTPFDRNERQPGRGRG